MTKFKFYNHGFVSIEENDLGNTLTLYFSDKGAEILDGKILESSRKDIVKPKLVPLAENNIISSLNLQFKVLERGDYIIGSVLYLGERHNKLTLNGVIAGPTEIKYGSPTDWQKTIINLGLSVLVVAFLLSFQKIMKYIAPKKEKHLKVGPPGAILLVGNVVMHFLAVAFACLMGLLIVALIYAVIHEVAGSTL